MPSSGVHWTIRVGAFVVAVALLAESIRLGLATHRQGVLAAWLMGAAAAWFGVGVVATTHHRLARRTGMAPPRRVSRARYAGMVTGGLAVSVALTFGGAVAGRVGDATANPLAIAGAPGYFTATGPQGEPLAVGRPWGTPCQPVVFGIGASVPGWIVAQIDDVVGQARMLGFDVTVTNQRGMWYPFMLYPQGLTDADVRFVPVSANAHRAPVFGDGTPEHIVFGWDATLDPGGAHEALTYLQAIIYPRNLPTVSAVDRAVRQLVAFSQGVSASTSPSSGILDNTPVNGFSSGDVSAMRTMSGCRLQPTG